MAHQRAALPGTDIISLVAHQLHEGIVPKQKEVAEKCNSNYITFYKYIFGYMVSFQKRKKHKIMIINQLYLFDESVALLLELNKGILFGGSFVLSRLKKETNENEMALFVVLWSWQVKAK